MLLGPHTFNFAEASEQAIAAGAALRCTDMAHAVQQALALVAPSTAHASSTDTDAGTAAHHTAPHCVDRGNSRLATMQQAALAFSQAHRGAAARIAADMQQRGWLD